MTRRLALLIANDLYESGALPPLVAPKADAEQLFGLLSDPEVGAFEPAEILTNRSKPEIERSVERMFRNAKPGDLLLLYYSGHGIRDELGRLHLAVWNTEPNLLHATAVSASFLKELLEETQASSVVILLDCCYSGAFSSGLKSRADVDLERELRAGSGVYVLTASTAVELAADGAVRASGEAALSMFTDAIVRGIATGAADGSGSGVISAADLWAYVRSEVPKKSSRQSPMQYGYFEEDVHIAHVRGLRLRTPRAATSRVHLGDLLGTLTVTEGVGLRAEEWLGTGRFVIPIGQAIRGGSREDVVFLDLARADGHLAVVGKVGSGKSTLLRTLISATALTHSPREAVFYCLDAGGNRLGSMRGLKPFVVSVAGDDQAADVRKILDEVSAHIQDRKRVFRENDIDSVASFRAVRAGLPGGPYPDVFLLIDRWGEFAESDPQFGAYVRRIANAGLDYGIHVVITARSWQELSPELEEMFPSRVELALSRPAESRFEPSLAEQLPADDPGWAILRGRRFRVALATLKPALGLPDEAFDETSDGAAELVVQVNRARIESGGDIGLARGTGPMRPAPLSETRDLLQLLGIADLAAFDLRRVWGEHAGPGHLRVPIGFGSLGEAVEVDLKEAAQDGMGPHGLVIGAAGSGKSELLRTLILALATTHPASAVNFVLVDFRDGATFAALGRLPHTAAVIANLADDLSLVDRLAEALNGEIARRSELLRQATYASARDYETARAGGADLAPLPSLLLIFDECFELLTAKPDFIDLLVGIGRLGRSLGIHLLLASQHLEPGRLRGLEAHLAFRIGLRTFSAEESRTALGVPDAHELPRSPGHGFLKFGTEPLVRFKAAYASGVYADQESAVASREDATVLDVLVTYLAERAVSAADPLWVPPLSRSPTLDELLGPVATVPGRGLTVADTQRRGTLRVPLALVDLPAMRRHEPLWLELNGAGGHVGVVGAPRSGKSTSVLTLICALALTHTPAEVQVYCLDFGGGALAAVRGLPHVGGVASRVDAEAVRRTVGEVAELLANRQRRFPELNLDSADDYRRHSSADHFGDVFLVVDGWSALRSEFEDLDLTVTEIAALGLPYGVHVVATATRWMDFRVGLRDLLGTRVELRQVDPGESSVSRQAAIAVPVGSPGRGLNADGKHLLIAEPYLAGGSTADLVGRVAEAWAGPQAPPVRLLPAVVPYASLDRGRTSGLQLPIGLAEADLLPVAVDFAADPHLLVFGDTESGKSSFLRSVAATIVERFTPQQARLIIVDYRRSLLGAVQTDHLLGYSPANPVTLGIAEQAAVAIKARLPGPDVTPQQLRDRSWWTGPELFVLIDDYDLVADAGNNPLRPLLEFVSQARDLGFHIVVARRSGGAARALYEPMLQRVHEVSSPALLLSGDPAEGPLFGRTRLQRMPPGRGQLLTRKEGMRTVQLAYLPPDI